MSKGAWVCEGRFRELSPSRSTASVDGALRLWALVTPPARGALGLGFGLVDRDVAAFHIGTVEALDRRIGLRVVVHLDEAEAFRLSGKLVCNQVDLGNVTKTFKGLAQVRVGNGVWQVAYVNVHSCLSLKIRALVFY